MATLRTRCCHKDPGDAPHPDPPQDHHHEPNQTEIVLGPQHVRGDSVLGAPVRPDPDELVTERLPEPLDQRLDPSLRYTNQQLPVDTGPEPQQPRRLEVVVVDQHPRTEAERPQLSPRLSQDDTSDLERALADDDLIPDGHVELREQLRPHQRPAPGEQAVVVRHIVLQHQLAIERKRRLDTA